MHTELDAVDLGAGHQRVHLAGVDTQIDDGTVAHIGPPTRQAVRKVAVGLQVVAPGLAPEAARDRAAFDGHRLADLPHFHQRRSLALSLAPPLRDRNIGCPVAEIASSHAFLLRAGDGVETQPALTSPMALPMSSATMRSSSSLLSSVRIASPPPSMIWLDKLN